MDHRTSGLIPGVTTLQLVSMYGDALLKQKRERERQYQREYYQRNRERIRERARARRGQHLEQRAEFREKNRQRLGEYHRDWIHGPDFKAWRAATWRAQDGLCYLCRRELGPERMAVIDHDHRCCPRGRSCEICRRGLACAPCNALIGFAGDDPARLELIARNLRAALDAVSERLAEQDGCETP